MFVEQNLLIRGGYSLVLEGGGGGAVLVSQEGSKTLQGILNASQGDQKRSIVFFQRPGSRLQEFQLFPDRVPVGTVDKGFCVLFLS